MVKGSAERAAIISMVTTTAVGIIEIWAALLFGSIAFVAAGIDALSDSVTSTGILAGLRLSKRRADKGHPYGHAQAETLVSLLLAAVLIFAGGQIAYLALEKLYIGAAFEATLELLLLAVAAIAIFGALASYKIRTGKRVNSLSLVADGYHTLTDSISAGAILVGLVFVRLGYSWVEPLIALGISALVIRWGLGIGRNALNILMEAAPRPKIVAKIRQSCLRVPGVISCHHIRARRVGSRIFADVHIYVNPKITVAKSHEIATDVERSLKMTVADLTSVVVHVEPTRGRTRGKKR